MEDLSALIFVALAVAWGAYLIPKALQHHDEAARTRPVDAFSGRLRVLARREAVTGSDAQLMVTPVRRTVTAPAGSPAAVAAEAAAAQSAAAEPIDLGGSRGGADESPADAVAPSSVAPSSVESGGADEVAAMAAVRRSTRVATRRRRRVLALLVLAIAAVAVVAGLGAIAWWYVALPGGLLVGWLVACRLMVKRERRALGGTRAGATPEAAAREDAAAPDAPAAADAAETPEGQDDDTATVPAAAASAASPPAGRESSLWDPLPVTLPTYVTKPVATRRSVRTIDLDDTGVWTSGRTQADAALAREADQAAAEDKQAPSTSAEDSDDDATDATPHAVGS